MSDIADPKPDTEVTEEEGEPGDGLAVTAGEGQDPVLPPQEIQELPEIKYECMY